MHAPKIELFDVAGMTNTDPKGFVRAVDSYRLADFGLYMARPIQEHPTLTYFRSWLLPAHGLRVSKWHSRPETPLDHDFYVDVVDIEAGGDADSAWRTVDLYLDILVRTGRDLRVLDTDEIVAAHTEGLLDDDTVRRAFERTFSTVDGIANAAYDVDAWLASQGISADWPAF